MKTLDRILFAIAAAALVSASFGLIPSNAFAGKREGGGHAKTSVHKDVNANRNKNVNVNTSMSQQPKRQQERQC